MTLEYECPCCGAELKVEDGANSVYCKECGTSLRYNPDAEFIDGQWRDLSTLTKQ